MRRTRRRAARARPNMTDRWAALIANASDPEGSPVEPSFSEVLGQLSRNDALLLDHIVERARQRGRAVPWTVPTIDRNEIRMTGPIRDPDDFMVSLDNLLRVRVLVHEPVAQESGASGVFFDADRIKLSSYGAKFARAVRRNQEETQTS